MRTTPDEREFGVGRYVWCSAHRRAHSTGWCTAEQHGHHKIGLVAQTACEAADEAKMLKLDNSLEAPNRG